MAIETRWIETRSGEPAKYPTLLITDGRDVLDLVADLKQALRRSEKTGGSYGVHRKDEKGNAMLSVEIHVGTAGQGRFA